MPRSGPPQTAGRWALLPALDTDPTRRAHAAAERLLDRHGVVTRGAVVSERVPGGFAAVYKVLAAFEETGRCRRGYFVDVLGAAQFGTPGRSTGCARSPRCPATPSRRRSRSPPPTPPTPTAPHFPGPTARRRPRRRTGHRPGRKAGALVVLVDGALTLYVERGGKTLLTWSDDADDARARRPGAGRRRPAWCARPADRREGRRRALLGSGATPAAGRAERGRLRGDPAGTAAAAAVPEGDAVWRTARRLDRALAGQVLTATDFRVPAIATADLSGGTVAGRSPAASTSSPASTTTSGGPCTPTSRWRAPGGSSTRASVEPARPPGPGRARRRRAQRRRLLARRGRAGPPRARGRHRRPPRPRPARPRLGRRGGRPPAAGATPTGRSARRCSTSATWPASAPCTAPRCAS